MATDPPKKTPPEPDSAGTEGIEAALNHLVDVGEAGAFGEGGEHSTGPLPARVDGVTVDENDRRAEQPDPSVWHGILRPSGYRPACPPPNGSFDPPTGTRLRSRATARDEWSRATDARRAHHAPLTIASGDGPLPPFRSAPRGEGTIAGGDCEGGVVCAPCI